MNFSVLTLVVLFFVGARSETACSTRSLNIDWTADWSSSSSSNSWSRDSSATCADNCAATEYDLDITADFSNLQGAWWELYCSIADCSWSTSLDVDSEFCGGDRLCNVFAGGNNSCNAVNYNFLQWYPTSCDASDDYNAVEVDFNITYKYGCCTDDNCNDDYDFSICEYNSEFGDYVSSMYECWNGVRKDIMKYLYCDNDGNITRYWIETCRSSGYWRRSINTCRYILSCDDEWQLILANFSDCACAAATDNGFDGTGIAEILETQWNTYCPDINLTCSSDGGAELWITRWYVNYRIWVGVTSVDDDTIDTIRSAIATAANADESLVTVSNYAEDVNRRRLQDDTTGTYIDVTVEVTSEEDAGEIEDNLNTNGETQVATDTGYTTDDSSSNTTSETTVWEGSGNLVFSSSIVSMVVIASVLSNLL